MDKLEYGGQVDSALVEGHKPDGEDLADADVQYHLVFVVCYAVDVEDDGRRHDLVPSEDLKNEPSAALEAAGAAEGVLKQFSSSSQNIITEIRTVKLASLVK